MTGWRLEGIEGRAGGFSVGPVDLEVPPGSAVALLGASGAGKTTLLRAVAGLGGSVRGRLLADGVDRSGVPPEARRVGFVPQGLALFPHLTVSGNVAYAASLRNRRRTTSPPVLPLARYGLEGLRNRWPHMLSTGEQQRVAVARALAAGPELLLWDEPLTALDRPARDGLIELLREVRDDERLPLLFVTHDPTLALSVADAALVLDHGSVEFVGPTERMVRSPTSPFVARFVGYENVFLQGQLDRRRPFASELADRGGPGGVCFRAPLVSDIAEGRFKARLRRAEPSAGGWEYLAESEGLSLRLRSEGAAPLRTGVEVGFDLAPETLVPIRGRAD